MLNRVFATPITPLQKTQVSTSDAFILMAYLVDGNSPMEADPKLIESVFNEQENPDAYQYGQFHLHNYLFDFKGFLNEYLVQTVDKGWNKVYAFSDEWVKRNSKDASLIKEIKLL